MTSRTIVTIPVLAVGMAMLTTTLLDASCGDLYYFTTKFNEKTPGEDYEASTQICVRYAEKDESTALCPKLNWLPGGCAGARETELQIQGSPCRCCIGGATGKGQNCASSKLGKANPDIMEHKCESSS